METVQYTARQRQLYERFHRILELPTRQQAVCVLLAVEMSLPIWKSMEQQNGVGGAAERLIASFNRWCEGGISDDDLESSCKALQAAVPSDLTKLQDPLPGMAGIALMDVKLIALDQCEDVHEDILVTAVCYAAVAACGGHPSPVWASWSNLTERQLDLLDDWWRKCSHAFPELR